MNIDDIGVAEKEEILFSVANAMKAFTAPALCSINGGNDVESGDIVGSGTIFTDQGKTFILTAGHVAEDAFVFKIPSYSTGNARPPAIITSSPKILGKPSDLALIEIDADTLDSESKVPFDLSVLAENSNFLEDDILFIHGFPGRFSRFSAIGNGIFSETLPYATVLGTSQVPEFKPHVHFAIEYKPEAQKNEQGQEVDLPPPPGLSGTAVWKTMRRPSGDKWSPEAARIVGIAHKWDQHAGSLMVTRVEVLREFLDRCKGDQG